MWINPNTDKGWTNEEEATFVDIMRIARMGRTAAIHFFRRCKSDHTKSLRLARENHGLSDAQVAAYKTTKALRLAGLARARQRVAQNRRIQLLEAAA